MYKSSGPTRPLQRKWLLLPISTMDRSRWYKAADPIAFPFRPPHRLQHVRVRSLYPCFACSCFEIFFLEPFQKRLTVVRSSKADSQPKVVARASSAQVHMRRRIFIVRLQGVMLVHKQTSMKLFRVLIELFHVSSTRFNPTSGWASKHARVAIKDDMIKRSQQRVSLHVQYRESHLNADFRDPTRLLHVNMSGDFFSCFIRAKRFLLEFHQATCRQKSVPQFPTAHAKLPTS